MANGQASRTGQTAGGILGAAIGSVVPGVGTAIGSSVGSGIGGLIGSGIDNRTAESQKPALEDPFQRQRLNEINQLSQSLSKGTDAGTQQAIEQAQKVGASTQGRLARVTGGASGQTIDALLKAQKNVQAATGQAVAAGQARVPAFLNLEQQLGNRIAQRKLELSQFDRQRSLAQAAQTGKESVLNLLGTAATQGSVPGGERDVLGDVLAGAGQKIGEFGRNAAGVIGDLFNRNQAAPFAGTVNPLPDTNGGERAPLPVGEPGPENQLIPVIPSSTSNVF